ncbi:hypothetical protein ABZ904_45600 [Streptomyces sp. NPDC046900]|uniref:hypothetical protein n=1 Tax=Streptomyces sp. NPDC046900 TaxID=3155473 RepID=UPI0033F86592
MSLAEPSRQSYELAAPCFYTALTWRTGTSHLTLAATAGEEWAGGRAGLAISR